MTRFAGLLSLALCLSSAAFGADYPAFLVAQFAASQGQLDAAATQMLAALHADPGNADLTGDAFALAVLADRPEAVQLATRIHDIPAAELLLADQDALSGNWAAAELGYSELSHDKITDLLRPILVAWAQAGRGLTDRALETLAPLLADPHSPVLYTLHAALIADLGHRDGEAQRLYTEAAQSMREPNLRVAELVASWRARSGDMEGARNVLDAVIQASPEAGMALPALLDNAATPLVTRPTDGIAEAYTALAAVAHQQQADDFATLLAHLALRLRKDSVPALLLIADMENERHHEQQAAAALARVPDGAPIAPVVQLRLAALQARLGETDAAHALLEKIAAAHPDRSEPLAQLGDLLSNEKKYPAAIEAYNRAINRVPRPGSGDWPLFYARGAAYERLHDLAHSEADMKRALVLSPNQPFVLNFLGFSWADQNRNLPEAHRMLQTALDARPNDGAITDSLGWCLLRQGDANGAVRLLEKAAELEPEDPTITGHLGDAYWQLGRHIEAQDQWRRALVLKPEQEDRARIEARLKEASAAK